MNEEHIRFVSADNLAGALDAKVVKNGVNGKILLTGLPVSSGEVLFIVLYDLNDLIAGARAPEAAFKGVLLVRHPYLVYKVVDILVVAGDGPEHGGGGVAPLLCGGKDIADPDMACIPLPVVEGRISRVYDVVYNACFVGKASGEYGYMGGIGERGVDAAHTFDLNAAAEILFEVGQSREILKVFVHHGVSRNNKKPFFHSCILLVLLCRVCGDFYFSSSLRSHSANSSI